MKKSLFQKLNEKKFLNFIGYDWVLIILFLGFVLVALFGLLPSILLTWDASDTFAFEKGFYTKLSKLDTEDKNWPQITAIATVAQAFGTVLLGLVGFFALFGAIQHLRKVETASRAELLTNLEQQATTADMLFAQASLYEIFSESEKSVKGEYFLEPVTDQQKLNIIKDISIECHNKLNALHESSFSWNREKYHILFRSCEFFETIGIMVEQGYVDIEDVISRFEVGIERVYACFGYHLYKRRAHMWASPQFFRHIPTLYTKLLETRGFDADLLDSVDKWER
ncbi:MAG: hypothetical protein EA405_00435 [Rhodospirillales bacterium]|nr:MAG: hypothetical protein EA405_00435 [Rhodospirillales bacterium]